MFSVSFFPLHIRGKEKSTTGGEASVKSSVVIRGSPQVRGPGSLSGMVGMGLENLREGEGVLRDLALLLHPGMESITALPGSTLEM